jgi:hypothetical protein
MRNSHLKITQLLQNFKEVVEEAHFPHSYIFPTRTAETWEESIWQEIALWGSDGLGAVT